MKNLGILLLVLGAICIGSSVYMNGRIEEGKGKISNARERVDEGNSLFSLNPLSKRVGQEFSAPVQEKIKAGEMEVQKYEEISHYLMIGGGLFIVIGIGLFFIRRKK